MSKSRPEIVSEDDRDYIFRFKLEPQKEVSGDPLTQLIRLQLQALLDVVLLVQEREEVKVEGFRFINSTCTHPIWPEEE